MAGEFAWEVARILQEKETMNIAGLGSHLSRLGYRSKKGLKKDLEDAGFYVFERHGHTFVSFVQSNDENGERHDNYEPLTHEEFTAALKRCMEPALPGLDEPYPLSRLGEALRVDLGSDAYGRMPFSLKRMIELNKDAAGIEFYSANFQHYVQRTQAYSPPSPSSPVLGLGVRKDVLPPTPCPSLLVPHKTTSCPSLVVIPETKTSDSQFCSPSPSPWPTSLSQIPRPESLSSSPSVLRMLEAYIQRLEEEAKTAAEKHNKALTEVREQLAEANRARSHDAKMVAEVSHRMARQERELRKLRGDQRALGDMDAIELHTLLGDLHRTVTVVTDELERRMLCVACSERRACVLYVACRHMVLCTGCDKHVKRCPTCNTEIVHRVTPITP